MQTEKECGCCFGHVASSEMTPCPDGHLFCHECILGYVQEAVQGAGCSRLSCLDGDCSTAFQRSQLMNILPKLLLEKLDERSAEESLRLARLELLIRCAGCQCALQAADSKFVMITCPDCGASTCVKCGRDWAKHRLRRCSYVDKDSDPVTSLRKKTEEEMTKAKVRSCPKCGTQVIKEEGCNQLSCRCGASLCYVCRKEAPRYTHFCQHQTPENVQKCPLCDRCPLWSNVLQRDELSIGHIRTRAVKRSLQMKDGDAWIGPPDDDASAKKLAKLESVEVIRTLRHRNVAKTTAHRIEEKRKEGLLQRSPQMILQRMECPESSSATATLKLEEEQDATSNNWCIII